MLVKNLSRREALTLNKGTLYQVLLLKNASFLTKENNNTKYFDSFLKEIWNALLWLQYFVNVISMQTHSQFA